MENETGASDAPGSQSLKYLTLQDMLWINLQVTMKVQHFNYAKLEESTFYQYGYGSSRDLVRQAGRFLGGFLRLHPFEAGNEATALIGCDAFLKMNGSRLKVSEDEATKWLEQVRNGQVRPEELLPTEPVRAHRGTDVQLIVQEVLERFRVTIERLREPEGAKASC